jgi:hypothetical protein
MFDRLNSLRERPIRGEPEALASWGINTHNLMSAEQQQVGSCSI